MDSPNTAARMFSGMDANIMRTTVSAEVMLSFSTHSRVIPTAPMQVNRMLYASCVSSTSTWSFHRKRLFSQGSGHTY